jgi:CubicO group peptidase (beta-lactamase class C family)
MKKRLVSSILVILLGLTMPGLVLAQGPTDPAEMEAFFDSEIQPAMDEQHIAGVTLVIVKDGEVFFTKGYGYADVAAGIPVDPETTLFRMGSSSKLFAWTAVMQLAEQGKVDMDADVNTYLDFEIPATYPDPITLKHLLAHTAGFEDRNYGTMARTPEDIVPLGEWLSTHIPARVQPVGEFTAYSNYGAALAGHIVAQVSGMSYEEYVTREIFQPLGMTRTSAYQSLPADLAADMSQGYMYMQGEYVPQPFEVFNISPAGASSATATDVARFMIAHLQDGQYDGARILETATAQQMHSRLFAHDERINGMAYGFMEMDMNGQHIIGHGGDTTIFHTQLALLPDEGIGFFAACNNAACMGYPTRLLKAFMAHYYPETNTPTPTADYADRAALVEGTYRYNRMSYTTAEKIMSLTMGDGFKMQDDGTLKLMSKGWTFVEVAPFVFRQTDGPYTLIFRCDGQSPATHAFLSNTPYFALERPPALANMGLQLAIAGLSLVLLLSFLIGGLVNYLVRRKRGKDAYPQLAQIARQVLAGAAGLSLLFLLLFALAVPGDFMKTGQIPLQGLSPIVFVLMVLTALAASGFTFLVWKNGYWGVFGRVHYTAVVLATWAFVWFAQYWRMMRW